ncbi:hypothetical protein V6N13_023776 [Hibiscus sabdariffa]
MLMEPPPLLFCRRSEPLSPASHPVKMSHTVGTTQVEDDISENSEKIADSVKTVKSEETVNKDKEKEADSSFSPEKSTNTGCELIEPEQSKDEEAVKWYNVRFKPGMNFEQQSYLLEDELSSESPGYLPNINDHSLMEVLMTKEDAAKIEGLDEVVSVEPFLGVHKFCDSPPPSPEGGYGFDIFWRDPFVCNS